MSQAVFMHFFWAITLIFILQLHIEVAKARVHILLDERFYRFDGVFKNFNLTKYEKSLVKQDTPMYYCDSFVLWMNLCGSTFNHTTIQCVYFTKHLLD